MLDFLYVMHTGAQSSDIFVNIVFWFDMLVVGPFLIYVFGSLMVDQYRIAYQEELERRNREACPEEENAGAESRKTAEPS